MDTQRRNNLISDMRNDFKSSYITKAQIKEFLGYNDHHAVDRLVKGLRKFNTKYYVRDIAERIMEVEKWNC